MSLNQVEVRLGLGIVIRVVNVDAMLSYFGKSCHALRVKYWAKKDKR